MGGGAGGHTSSGQWETKKLSVTLQVGSANNLQFIHRILIAHSRSVSADVEGIHGPLTSVTVGHATSPVAFESVGTASEAFWPRANGLDSLLGAHHRLAPLRHCCNEAPTVAVTLEVSDSVLHGISGDVVGVGVGVGCTLAPLHPWVLLGFRTGGFLGGTPLPCRFLGRLLLLCLARFCAVLQLVFFVIRHRPEIILHDLSFSRWDYRLD